MGAYYDFVQNYLSMREYRKCDDKNHERYSEAGHSFCFNSEEADGVYWFYEGEDFIIDIHDMFIKKEIIQTNISGMDNFFAFYSSYLINANGESFNPYQNLSPNSLYIVDGENCKNYRFILHPNSHYLGVGISFRRSMIEEYLRALQQKDVTYQELFFNPNAMVNKPFERIARDILNCTMTSPAAELFFESKAKEWLSITIDAFLNKDHVRISVDDHRALEDVANYLDDHYAASVSQETLTKIATMSGTKLKKLFKQKYRITITEYLQRKRMNMAEILLLNSSLKIQDIAEAVGYTSHSKFSACFKRYKGVYPKDIKKHTSG